MSQSSNAAPEQTTLTVARPWGWMWWPESAPLINQHPDVTDGREPRRISTAIVDWCLILDAVRHAVRRAARHAVSQVPLDVDDLLSLPEVEVEVPVLLNDEEKKLAQTWVGRSHPVIYWAEEASISDGRHRLWLSKPHYATRDVPLFDNHLTYLEDAPAGVIQPRTVAESIVEELVWWKTQPDLLRQANELHLNVLRRLQAQLDRG